MDSRLRGNDSWMGAELFQQSKPPNNDLVIGLDTASS